MTSCCIRAVGGCLLQASLALHNITEIHSLNSSAGIIRWGPFDLRHPLVLLARIEGWFKPTHATSAAHWLHCAPHTLESTAEPTHGEPALAFHNFLTLKYDRDTMEEKRSGLPHKHSTQRACGAAQPVLYLVGCPVFSHSILAHHPIEHAGKALMNQALSYSYRWDVAPISQLEK